MPKKAKAKLKYKKTSGIQALYHFPQDFISFQLIFSNLCHSQFAALRQSHSNGPVL